MGARGIIVRGRQQASEEHDLAIDRFEKESSATPCTLGSCFRVEVHICDVSDRRQMWSSPFA
jgi:hypothetical protein